MTNNMVSKPQTRRSLPRLPQEQLPNPVCLPQDAPKRSTKRQFNEVDQSPTTKAHTQQPEVEGEGTQPTEKLGQNPGPEPPSVRLLQNQPANSKHKFILEWLESAGSNRDRRCRSENHLQPAADNPVPPRLTRSALAMSHTPQADNGLKSSTPHLTATPSEANTPNASKATKSPSKKSPVEDQEYRSFNLFNNHIHYDRSYDPTPVPITELLETVRQTRGCPVLSEDEIRQDRQLEELSRGRASESTVKSYFLNHVFSDPGLSDLLIRSMKAHMYHVPNTDPDPEHRVSMPVPDALYGYTIDDTFPRQRRTLKKGMLANSDGLLFPFLLVEFKGKSGHLWVATNQCLGGSATCVNNTEMLNDELGPDQSTINSAAFSIAIHNTDARLYVTWKDKDKQEYHMKDVGSYLLHVPEQSIKFCNIFTQNHILGPGQAAKGDP
ncbi:hypothetical protein CEP52_016171 [Fusarium oligoseptatum]|uniref:DUF7924 domain-containing protein n=1 Tax=Fusarium oligoseptatum TaxID=2604345 RepID=A0A428S6A2_9HYPO|nr:hypothetical protein CEP52_016171 [Fusarium oligoseptatum]